MASATARAAQAAVQVHDRHRRHFAARGPARRRAAQVRCAFRPTPAALQLGDEQRLDPLAPGQEQGGQGTDVCRLFGRAQPWALSARCESRRQRQGPGPLRVSGRSSARSGDGSRGAAAPPPRKQRSASATTSAAANAGPAVVTTVGVVGPIGRPSAPNALPLRALPSRPQILGRLRLLIRPCSRCAPATAGAQLSPCVLARILSRSAPARPAHFGARSHSPVLRSLATASQRCASRSPSRRQALEVRSARMSTMAGRGSLRTRRSGRAENSSSTSFRSSQSAVASAAPRTARRSLHTFCRSCLPAPRRDRAPSSSPCR